MHALSGRDTVSYYYAFGNDMVIKVLQDGYLPPILGDTDVILSFMVQELAMCYYVLQMLLRRTWLYNLLFLPIVYA